MKNIYKNPILCTLLFTSYPVLFLFAVNIKTLQYADLLVPLILVEIIALILLVVNRVIFGSLVKASIFSSFVMLVILSYGYIFDYLRRTPFNLIINGKYIVMYGMILVIGGGLFYFLKKIRRSLQSAIVILNLVSFFLILLPSYYILEFQYIYWTQQKDQIYKVTLDTKKTNINQKPDIYYIIFDRYASEDVLDKTYRFDNSDMVNYLRQKGFIVTDKSNANYISTELSLSSSLNLEYLDNLIDQVESESGDVHPLHQMMENNALMRYLESMGYKYIHFGSWWGPTALNRYANENVNILSLSEFSDALYQRSIIYPIMTSYNIPLFNNRLDNWKRVIFQFKKLEEIPEQKEPTFVFAHFLITHPPYVFDDNGDYLTEEQVNSMDEKTVYIKAVEFNNTKIKEMVDAILNKTTEPKPIIVIQADEGPYPPEYDANAKTFEWSEATEEERTQKMGIINAYYLPGVDNSDIYQSITPVNSFRLILNKYFGQSFPLLPDISYYSNKGKPYKPNYILSDDPNEGSRSADKYNN